MNLDANEKTALSFGRLSQGWSGIAEGSKELVFSRDAAIVLSLNTSGFVSKST